MSWDGDNNDFFSDFFSEKCSLGVLMNEFLRSFIAT